MIHDILKIGSRVTVVPVTHGSGDFAWEVRELMLKNDFDCLAVPLPDSFRVAVEQGIEELPIPSIVVQKESGFDEPNLSSFLDSEDSEEEVEDSLNRLSYVPIDPCQPVIAALRTAMGERIPRYFIDLETSVFESYGQCLPDAFALKRIPIHKFAASLLPVIQRPDSRQRRRRIRKMATTLKELCIDYRNILFVCDLLDWPWIKEAFDERNLESPEHEPTQEPERLGVEENSLYFFLGELPYITGLYEHARGALESDDYLSIDGIKSLLISARERYRADLKGRARQVTPHLLATCLKYLRNLTLMDRRFSPDLSDLVLASQQVFGDPFAIHVFETAKEYPFRNQISVDAIRMGIEQCELPDGSVYEATSRLPGIPVTWRELQIKKKPDPEEIKKWQQKWNPFQQCSWPPEDEKIESFRQTVLDRAQQIMGADLARTEKFTSSIKDGIDIRDTLRHWYEGEIYVKVLPPNRGFLDCAVMLFDSPADPRDYPWRTTWFAEHDNESTLAFFATDYSQNPVGPGICLGQYGGAMFLFPPRSIPDIWTDPRLNFVETMEERILAAACLHSESKAIALLAPAPPGAGWRRLAKKYGKTLVHLPLAQFSQATIAQLRYVHVLNGHQIRSYAADFIRKA